ncbi:Pectin lyase-like superfamily protein [Prunus dulcis]|uniref:Pectin lyase-like superfamily protein n=1 Tax=Prunus dulcis TaxID=3755 RepID=A0A4Y1RSN2_PRUDU|nr:Pectin lyase-like superfamily protein [Prunus dulcis]
MNLNPIAISSISLSIWYGQTIFNVLQFDAVGDGQTDDSEAFLKAWEALCGATEAIDTGTPTLVVPAEKTFLLQPIIFSGPCKSNSVHVQILGKIVAPNTLHAWKECKEFWISFSEVTNLTINGTGEIDGNGKPWWSKARQLHHVAIHFYKCDYLQLRGLKHLDSPKAHITINNCNNVSVSNLHIIAPEDSPNTDGIDISMSTFVNIHNSTIGTGDDCIALNNGSSHINITSIVCGPGHGISVGSLGEDGAYETAEEVHVRNCTFNGTKNGARIKTWQGGSGYVKGISFEKITLIGAKNPIIIDQYYCDKNGHNCKPSASAVNVSNVIYTGFQGTYANEEEAIIFDCSNNPGCQNVTMNQINITSTLDPGKNISAACKNNNFQMMLGVVIKLRKRGIELMTSGEGDIDYI